MSGPDFGLGLPELSFGAAGVGSAFQLNDPTTSTTYGYNQTYGGGGLERQDLSFNHRDGGNSVSGGATIGSDLESLSLGATQGLAGGLSLSERLGVGFGEGGPTTTFGFGTRSSPLPGLSLGTDLNLSMGPEDSSLGLGANAAYRSDPFALTLGANGSANSDGVLSGGASASGTMQLLPNLYGNAFGNVSGSNQSDQANWFAGGGLTYMAGDNLGLTAAGGYGSEGWETRLQADFFKNGVSGAGSLEDQRRGATVSAFLGASGGGNRMNDQFGAPDVSSGFGGTTFTAGIGVGF